MANKIAPEILEYNASKEAEDKAICAKYWHAKFPNTCRKLKTKSGMLTRFGFWMATP